MRIATRLAALLLLALSARAVTATSCATRGVPAATLLLPYFHVARNGTQGADIPEGGADTLVAITNTGPNGVIVGATVWNKYGRPVLAFNVPLAGYDVAYWRMKDILNGHLNVNPNAEDLDSHGNPTIEVCGQAPHFDQWSFIRLQNPDPADAAAAASIYADPAFSGAFRRVVWDSLDESGDVTSLSDPRAPGVVDADNPGCGGVSDGQLSGEFSGSVTFDVLNYCTNRFPDDGRRYTKDALATAGWSTYGYTPNVLMGDVFYVEPGATPVATGEELVALPFDERLDWRTMPTFYARYSDLEGSGATAGFAFVGDGRMPLPTSVGYRYLDDAQAGMTSRLIVYHTERWKKADGTFTPDLCAWWSECRSGSADCRTSGPFAGRGIYDLETFDDDSNYKVCIGCTSPDPRIFLESQRFDLKGNADFNPAAFRSGWTQITFLGDPRTSQGLVWSQHTAPGGLLVTVPGTALSYPYSCAPTLVNTP
jgi:hypothetical protein